MEKKSLLVSTCNDVFVNKELIFYLKPRKHLIDEHPLFAQKWAVGSGGGRLVLPTPLPIPGVRGTACSIFSDTP